MRIAETSIRELTAALASTRQALAERDAQLARFGALPDALAQQRVKLASLEAELLASRQESQALYRSLSWRAAAPLRAVLRQLRGY